MSPITGSPSQAHCVATPAHASLALLDEERAEFAHVHLHPDDTCETVAFSPSEAAQTGIDRHNFTGSRCGRLIRSEDEQLVVLRGMWAGCALAMKLRTTLLLGTIAPIAFIACGVVFALQQVLDREAQRRLATGIQQTHRILDDLQQFRASQIRAQARMLANEPRLKAVMATAGVTPDTVLGVIQDLRSDLASDLFLVTHSDGIVVADATGRRAVGSSLADDRLVATALADGEGAGIWIVDQRAYQVHTQRLGFGDQPVGVVAIGFELTNELAETVQRHSGSQIALVLGNHTIARSSELGDLVPPIKAEPCDFEASGTLYRIASSALAEATDAQPLAFVILRDQGRVLAAKRSALLLVYAISALGIALGIAIAVGLARRLSKPVDELVAITSAVAGGDLARQAFPAGPSELRTLGATINHMVFELRSLHGDLERRVEERTRALITANERLAESAEFLGDIYKAMPGALFVFDRDGKIVTVNHSATTLLGCAEHELVGRLASEVIEPFPDLAESHGDTVERTERNCVTRSGDRIPVLFSATSFKATVNGERQKQGLVSIAVDVRDRKRLEMELRQAQKLESVGRLAAGIAHEINTPIQFISDSVTFVAEAWTDAVRVITARGGLDSSDVEALAAEIDLPYLLEEVPGALARSLDGLARVGKIVRSMKQFAYPDHSDMRAVDLNQAVASTLAIAGAEFKYVADLELSLGDLPPVVCFASEINQVILNVVVNAAHAIEDTVRGSDRRGKITVTTSIEGPHAVIAIADTGGGIPAAIRDRIFDPFFTTKEVGRGTGQGLAIARSVVVDKHGGELTVESELGTGTTFFLRLPLERATREHRRDVA
jgi:PAS domain S-box-containing protein